MAFDTLSKKITDNLDYHSEKLSPFKLLVMLECSV